VRRIIFLFLTVLLLSGVSSLNASDYLTLENTINLAIERNPGLKSQDQDVLAKDMDKNSQFAQMLPSADLSYGYMRINDVQSMTLPLPQPMQPITLPMSQKDNYQFDVQAKQILFAGGALYNNYLIAKNDHLASEQDRQRYIRNLKLTVIDAYYGVIKARQQRELAKSNVSSVKSHLDVANAFFNQGMIPKNDLLEAQVTFAQSEELLIMADNSAKIAEANLNILLQRNLLEDVNIDTEIPITNMEITFDQSLSTALENRQEIKTAQLQVENSSKGINIARSAFMPSVAATYAYERTGEDPDTNDYDTWKAGLGLNWNLFSGGSSYWNYNKAKYMNLKAGYQMESLKNLVTLEVKNSYLNIQEATARLQVAEKAIVQAEELARIQRDRYNLQVATTTDVLDAQTLLVKAKNNYLTARADHARAIAALKASMGTL
jgi:outer membrane protein TolC